MVHLAASEKVSQVIGGLLSIRKEVPSRWTPYPAGSLTRNKRSKTLKRENWWVNNSESDGIIEDYVESDHKEHGATSKGACARSSDRKRLCTDERFAQLHHLQNAKHCCAPVIMKGVITLSRHCKNPRQCYTRYISQEGTWGRKKPCHNFHKWPRKVKTARFERQGYARII